LIIKDADEVIIRIALATNFKNYNDLSVNPYEKVAATKGKSSKKNMLNLPDSHICLSKVFQ
jgi:alpha-L-fucosidase 2